MYKKGFTLLSAIFIFIMGASAQTIRENIEKEMNNPKQEERAAKADKLIHNQNILTEKELEEANRKPFSADNKKRVKKKCSKH